ncbi:winged helix-turn-helix transcriptional regulator [Rhizobium bangladeshense]|nr:helix-turn-helix domain-containing protein [Rhizobium bangladeshense]
MRATYDSGLFAVKSAHASSFPSAECAVIRGLKISGTAALRCENYPGGSFASGLFAARSATTTELGVHFFLRKYGQKCKVLTKMPELEISLARKQGNLPDSCGLGSAFAVIGGKWKALLLWQIHQAQPCRFGELKRLVPEISEKMLIQHLREMEADGVIHREVFHQVPPRVEYSVTETGADLDYALAPVAEWGKKHQARTEKDKGERKHGDRHSVLAD